MIGGEERLRLVSRRDCWHCPEGTTGLSLGFQPQERVHRKARPERAEEICYTRVTLTNVEYMGSGSAAPSGRGIF